MAAKAILVFCAQALLIQLALGQCIGRGIDAGVGYGQVGFGLAPTGSLAYEGIGAGLAGRGLGCNGFTTPLEFTATRGGALPVTSSSAIAPTGISVVSENVYEGTVSMAGELPFVGTTGMEGALPTTGAGAINHACGDGNTAMISEATIAPAAAVTPAAVTASGLIPGAGLASAARFGPAGFGPSGFGPAGFGAAAGLAPAGLGIGPVNGLGLGGCGRGVLY